MNMTSGLPNARIARVICLSVLYMLLVFLVSSRIQAWMIVHASPSVATGESVKNLKQSGYLFVLLNSLVFAGSLLWLGRTREFSPVARYLIPTLLAVGITYLVLLPVELLNVLPSPGVFIATRAGLLVYWIDSVIPGFVAAQIFRFPRHGSTLKTSGSIHD